MGDIKNAGILSGVNISKDKAAAVGEVADIEKAISGGAGSFVEAAISTLAGNDSKPIDAETVNAAFEKAKDLPAAVGNVLSGVKVDSAKAAEVSDVADTEKKLAGGAEGALKKTLGSVMGVD